jgi:transposase
MTSTDISAMYRGMRYEFLPPYSPDYNPIELAFSAMKYRLRRNGEYIRMAMTELSDTEVYCTLLEALYQGTEADAFGWFRHCGYV